jgi:hypothetical protein
MTRLALLLALSAAAGYSQRSEFGARAGFAAAAAPDVSTSSGVVLGAEFCGLCSGTFAFFAEYNHLETLGSARSNGITRFGIVAGGVRLQGGRGVRPFFDAGVAYGVDSFRWSSGSDSHGNPGIVLAGGAAIGLKEGLYIRPQFRLYALRDIHVVAAATAGFGMRF